MKKLLVLALVLGLATVANATISLSIVDNGDGTFGIAQDGTFSAMADNVNIFAVASTSETIPTGGTITAEAPVATYIGDGVSSAALPADVDGIFAWIADTVNKDYAGGTYIDGVSSAVGTTVSLYITDDLWETATLVQSVTLTPEPMTLGLLAIGGLFLRRRK